MGEALAGLFTSPLMLRSLLAALLVGLCAPIVGTYLVHRRMAMLGDGIGHVSLTGVALGWIAGTAANVTPSDQWALPGALVVSILGAVTIEVVRLSGRTSADVALAMLFYGGIATGVLLIGLAGGTSTQLNSYLFGSISTVQWGDVYLIGALCALILLIGLRLSPALYAVTDDEDFAHSTGLPVAALSILIAILSALTVAVAMRVVGSLLVSALMIVPVAIAQLVTRSFRSTMACAMALGTVLCVDGLVVTYFVDVSPGALIVVAAIVVYILGFVIKAAIDGIRRGRRLQVTGGHTHLIAGDPHAHSAHPDSPDRMGTPPADDTL